MLCKISLGLSSEHLLYFFVDMYAPNRHFLFWRQVVNAHLDIWAIWFRLYDRSVAFQPGKRRSTFGVFSMLYLREITGTRRQTCRPTAPRPRRPSASRLSSSRCSA